MPLLTMIFALIVVGVVLYLVQTYIPMAPPIKLLLQVVIVLGVCWWLLSLVMGTGPIIRMPSTR